MTTNDTFDSLQNLWIAGGNSMRARTVITFLFSLFSAQFGARYLFVYLIYFVFTYLVSQLFSYFMYRGFRPIRGIIVCVLLLLFQVHSGTLIPNSIAEQNLIACVRLFLFFQIRWFQNGTHYQVGFAFLALLISSRGDDEFSRVKYRKDSSKDVKASPGDPS